MAISALSSSLSLSKTISFLSPSTPTSKTQCQSPHKSKTHLGFPLSSPSISLYTLKNPRTNRNGGLTITSMVRTFNAVIAVEEDEPEESIIRRFNREALRAGVFQESRRRRYYETPREKRKRKALEAMKRNRRRRFQPQPQPQTSEEEEDPEELFARVAKEDDEDDVDEDDFDDDNWEFREGDLPYSW